MQSILKLGTRKSMLAWAQSSWVAREIERENPGTRVELVGIETRGDRILDISLQAAAEMTGGKEFFVAEIDEALRTRAVDLTVHSMKDLSLDRPADFACAAIPARENPRDVIVFAPNVLDRLRQGATLKIGTSSPRRLENVPPFLAQALPRLGGSGTEPQLVPRVQLVEIRGNVNTRLGRISEPAGSERSLDGVILAFAGLIRLWKDEKGREELRRLLSDARWMVLPLRECPAAPAQGALAVECRGADSSILAKIRKIHCATTEEHVLLERSLLAQWGGGCHQKFGATAISTAALSKLFFIRGKKPDGSFVDELRWSRPPAPGKGVVPWDGSAWRSKAGVESGLQTPGDFGNPVGRACFVAHWRAISVPAPAVTPRIWTSGVTSWHRLAGMGYWVEGCAENLGFDSIRSSLSEGVLQLPEFRDWNVLTHEGAEKDWDAHVTGTYRLVQNAYSEEAARALERATHVFWSSGSQSDELKKYLPARAHQACGGGKTAEHLNKAGVKPTVFPSVEEWRKWIKED